MSLPEILLLVLSGLALLITANRHGKPRTGRYNFWATAIGTALQIGLLYWAGLFH